MVMGRARVTARGGAGVAASGEGVTGAPRCRCVGLCPGGPVVAGAASGVKAVGSFWRGVGGGALIVGAVGRGASVGEATEGRGFV